MACLDMYNNSSDHKSVHRRAPASPRISFSSDFVDIQQSLKHQQRSPAPVSSASPDFEFSVSNHSMMPADELFFQGRLLPFKDSNRAATTLRDELLVEEDEDQDALSHRPSRGRWKGFLGLKKSHYASKKACRSDGSSGSRNPLHTKSPFGCSPLSGTTTNSSQGQNEEGSSCNDQEIDF